MIKTFNIKPISTQKANALQEKIDSKTKPLGALGRLETLALQIGCVQNTLSPTLEKPMIVIFAGDHGITAENVSPYPQAVTYQMVLNFLAGGAAINVFAKHNQMSIKIVDAGVNDEFAAHPQLIQAKIGFGTKNFLCEAAMTEQECQQAIQKGAEIVAQIHAHGCNTIGFGEMGIGNTSSAAVLMHLLTDIPLENCVGSGTGLDKSGIQHKFNVLKKAIAQRNISKAPLTVLSTFGGFEIAMMVGAYLQAAELEMLICVDGFIATAALLVAIKLYPDLLDYCIFTHQSQEKGHQLMLNALTAQPLCNLEMRLGEGTGIAVTFPIILAAVNFLNEMASFESAGVSSIENGGV
ncbi:MAG: nicotinate-nucleotide--dimethylbenzimidazole phosphoribosyltransferase [Candidatus Parabeggiatoa sp. nov. 2]|nr:MAG: nicotinate-nucleotide--dimethylbenzimidazole phosphoribosyltransferase [Gammaproteobacteria bacterium]HEC83931.1 nicotinate-nucleotide--dimethylbenzimidazole phosphoribosyltransferase [Thioploca sp.]